MPECNSLRLLSILLTLSNRLLSHALLDADLIVEGAVNCRWKLLKINPRPIGQQERTA